MRYRPCQQVGRTAGNQVEFLRPPDGDNEVGTGQLPFDLEETLQLMPALGIPEKSRGHDRYEDGRGVRGVRRTGNPLVPELTPAGIPAIAENSERRVTRSGSDVILERGRELRQGSTVPRMVRVGVAEEGDRRRTRLAGHTDLPRTAARKRTDQGPFHRS